MTSPNFNDPDQMPDAGNAGAGLGSASSTTPAQHLQGQFNSIGGPLGAVAGWMLGGLAAPLIADAEDVAAAGVVQPHTNAAEKVFEHITDIRSKVTGPLADLLDAMTGEYEGDDPALLLIQALFQPLRKLLEVFSGILGGTGSTPAQIESGWNSLQQRVSDAEDAISTAVQNAVDAAVQAVVNGMNGIGEFATAIMAAIADAIQDAIGAIFGDGGTKWGQELYVAAGPVTQGFNDVPLGFGMPFSGKITDLSFYSNDHIGSGSVVVETRRNGTAIHTDTWSGGNNSYTASGLSLDVTKGDRITFYVTTVTSQAANMSVSVIGRYV